MRLPNGHVFIWTATLLPVAAVALVPGQPAHLRTAFGFDLRPRNATPTDVLDILAANIRVLLVLTLLTIAARVCTVLGRATDVLVLAIIGGNAAIVGAAAGAYGLPSLPYLTHLPLEWLAFGMAAQTHVTTRRRARTVRGTMGRSAFSLGLLGASAVIETL